MIQGSKWSLSRKMVLLILLVLVLPIATIGLYLYANVTNEMLGIEKERTTNSTRAAKSLIDKMGSRLMDAMKPNAYWADNHKAVGDKDIAWIEENINVMTDVVSNLHIICTTDLEGNVLSQVGDVKEFSGKMAVPAIAERLKKESSFSGLVLTSKGLAMVAVSKITDEQGQAPPTGVLIFGRILDNKALEDIKATLQEEVVLLTGSDLCLTTMQEVAPEKLKGYMPALMAPSAADVFESTVKNNVLTSQVLSHFTDIGGHPLGVIYIGHVAEANSQVANQLKTTSLMAGAVIALLLFVVIMLLRRQIVKPIDMMAVNAKEIADGTLRQPVEAQLVRRNDEIGQLAQAFEAMRANLRELIEGVSNVSSSVAGLSKELSLSAQDTGKASNQVAQAIKEVADGAAYQSEHVASILKMMKNTEEQVETGQQEALKTAENALASTEAAHQGQMVMATAISGLGRVKETVEAATQSIQRLMVRSGEISDIVTIIGDISNQTNLLALNAAIEAARAGEQGRGFAVVAEEVRKLAEESKGSAEKITRLIQDILAETAETVRAMESNREAVDGQVGAIHQSERALVTMVGKVEQTEADSQKIREIFGTLKGNAISVLDSLKSVADITDESAAASEHVAAAAEEQSATVETIAENSVKLAALAERMRQDISKFEL
ncbi:HAMP domain-containing protein [Heliobacterium chlorum]|uniref:HAMP domain-containing protein n=1 Tax=Heliobacterium chlorum TaxID=2698 RepID=A0ABR7T082_HELCL|nr:methyl-accepting chemotaxis protein [Heliobacterium chlorum]MBC9782976.1 HAMP domain-containing protein [Heliobacterium chlorum]